jgi:subfamily B ATP-binding cassette protein HlyB/CyaB
MHNQQFLVESVVGMRTLKAASVEASLQGEWDGKLARFINIACRANVLDAIRQCIIQYIGKLTTALILLCGARLVMAGEMTIGSLVAFNMLAELISVPLLRLAALWQDFQQTQVSVARLGDILRQQSESLPAAPVGVPPLRGVISIRQVVFRYKDGGREILKGVSLEIPAGQVLGIVGPSGSGKSTLTKLLQRLYLPQGGQIAVDGMDIADMHPHWLRQQIGTVLQENLLFKRTVHDNIALAAPYITREQVVAAARMAGADEFISRLPQGYDTPVEERGSNFSGGERQRIAIARALTRDPRILILDEATSAVDYISEQIIQNNLKEIARGRTVIIIAHRLAAVRGCDRIISLVDGEIVEDGAHDDLIRREGGLYRHLWTLQSAVV